MSAIVPYALWMCGIRVVYVLSAIEPTYFLQVLETSPYREVLPKFLTNVFFILHIRGRERSFGGADRLRRCCWSACTAATRHCPDSSLPRYPFSTATLGINQLYSFVFVVECVNELGVSRPKEIRLDAYRSVCVSDRICFGLSMFLGQPAYA